MQFTRSIANRHRRGFTLAEVLAALLFMAIVIPVAVHGLQIASQAGQVSTRKMIAAQIADRILNENLVTTQGTGTEGNKSGTIQQGPYSFRYETRNEAWTIDAMRRLSVEVYFNVQGREYDVRLSTLLDTSVQ
jgi:prepilin-type N-terminal cleavage/methylation domain-containing protein